MIDEHRPEDWKEPRLARNPEQASGLSMATQRQHSIMLTAAKRRIHTSRAMMQVVDHVVGSPQRHGGKTQRPVVLGPSARMKVGSNMVPIEKG